MFVRKIGRLKPRHSISFFRENPELFKKLKLGESVEVPQEVFKEMEGVEEVQFEESAKKKKRKNSLDESSSMDS